MMFILSFLLSAAGRHDPDELSSEGADEAVDEKAWGGVDGQDQVVEVDQTFGGGDAVTRVARCDHLKQLVKFFF